MASEARATASQSTSKLAVVRIGEHQMQRIALVALEPPVRAINHLGRLIPRQHVPAPAKHDRRAARSGCASIRRSGSSTCSGPESGGPDEGRPCCTKTTAGRAGRRGGAVPWDRAQGFGERRENLVGRRARPALVPATCTRWCRRRRASPPPRGAGPAFVGAKPLGKPDGGRGQALPA